MTTKSEAPNDGCVNPFTESLVVLQVFTNLDGCPRRKVDAELSDLDPSWVEESVQSLTAAGVITVAKKVLHPSLPLRRLTDLYMVTI
jgi:hypothetical protein